MSSRIPSTYRLYKNGTTKILNWLYENAVKCGYSVDEDGSDGEEDERGAKKKRKPKVKGKGKKGHGSKAKGMLISLCVADQRLLPRSRDRFVTWSHFPASENRIN